MSRSRSLAVLCLALVAMSVSLPVSHRLGSPVEARAADGQNDSRRGCTVRRLRGTYGVIATGTIVTPPPGAPIPAGPFATVGTLSIDEDGKALLNATRSFNGLIVPEVNLPGTVTLDSDCTGSAEFQGGRTFDLVVLDGFDEMHWIQTNPGAVVTVTVERM